MIQLPFFFRQVFLLISNRVGRAKRMEKCSARSQPVKQSFLQYKTAQYRHIHVVYTVALFELHFVQLDYKENHLVVPLTDATSQFP